MVRAVSNDETKRVELSTLPGGYVLLRKLTYGEDLRKRDIGTNISPGQGTTVEVKMDNLAVEAFEFERSIVEHNLTDENDQPLNLGDKNTLMRLDVSVAREIEEAINDINSIDGDSPKSLPKILPVGT